jgi:predicted nucleic acid-binding protein
LIVVSDTSPVLNLARIGRLQLLALLYHQVLIPSAVYDELTASKSDLPPAIDLASQPWLMVATAHSGISGTRRTCQQALFTRRGRF